MTITSVLDRLLLWQKFLILSAIALALTLVPTSIYVHQSNKSLDSQVKEESGLGPVSSMLRVVQLTQQHRGLAALELGGVDSARAERSAKEAETQKAFEALAPS